MGRTSAAGGPAVTAIAPPGSLAHALYAAREEAGIGRSEMAVRINRGRREGEPLCYPSNITMWEGGKRPITEKVIDRYARALALVPVLVFVSKAEGRRVATTQRREMATRLRAAGVSAERVQELVRGVGASG